MDKQVWLSIDWDAFIPEKVGWDWGHSEGQHPDLQAALWEIRVAGLLANDIDVRQQTAFSEDMHPENFWSALQAAGYNLDGAQCGIAESHRSAASFFLTSDNPRNARILHVDAHHDLGYQGKKSLNEHVKAQRVDAGNWLGVYLRLFPDVRADLVFPSWKPTAIEDTLQQAPMTKSVRKRITLAQWPAVPAAPADCVVTHVFVCRSGAWSPPWHDQAFATFIEALQERSDTEVECLDGESLEPRPWDDARTQAQADVQREMMKQLRLGLPPQWNDGTPDRGAGA